MLSAKLERVKQESGGKLLVASLSPRGVSKWSTRDEIPRNSRTIATTSCFSRRVQRKVVSGRRNGRTWAKWAVVYGTLRPFVESGEG